MKNDDLSYFQLKRTKSWTRGQKRTENVRPRCHICSRKYAFLSRTPVFVLFRNWSQLFLWTLLSRFPELRARIQRRRNQCSKMNENCGMWNSTRKTLTMTHIRRCVLQRICPSHVMFSVWNSRVHSRSSHTYQCYSLQYLSSRRPLFAPPIFLSQEIRHSFLWFFFCIKSPVRIFIFMTSSRRSLHSSDIAALTEKKSVNHPRSLVHCMWMNVLRQHFHFDAFFLFFLSLSLLYCGWGWRSAVPKPFLFNLVFICAVQGRQLGKPKPESKKPPTSHRQPVARVFPGAIVGQQVRGSTDEKVGLSCNPTNEKHKCRRWRNKFSPPRSIWFSR